MAHELYALNKMDSHVFELLKDSCTKGHLGEKKKKKKKKYKNTKIQKKRKKKKGNVIM